MCARHTLILGLALPQSESLWRDPEIALAGSHQSSPPTSSFITLNVYSLCIAETEQDHKLLHQARPFNKPPLKTQQCKTRNAPAAKTTSCGSASVKQSFAARVAAFLETTGPAPLW